MRRRNLGTAKTDASPNLFVSSGRRTYRLPFPRPLRPEFLSPEPDERPVRDPELERELRLFDLALLERLRDRDRVLEFTVERFP